MWFQRRRAPVEEPAQFLIPKNVTWNVEDVFALQLRGDYAEALKRWDVLLTPFADPQFAHQIVGMKSHRVIWLNRGLCFRHLERYRDAMEAYERAAALAVQAGDHGLLAEVQNAKGVVYRHQGMMEQSLKTLAEALRTARKAGDIGLEATVHDNIAHCYRLQNRGDEALKEERRAYDLFRSDPSAASTQIQGRVMANLGLMLVAAGRREEGMALARQGLERSRQAGDLPQVELMTSNLRALG